MYICYIGHNRAPYEESISGYNGHGNFSWDATKGIHHSLRCV